MIQCVKHIGIAVNSIDETMERWARLYGAVEEKRSTFAEIGQTSALVRIGPSYFELMEPYGEKGVVSNYLAKHGPGLHHISLLSDALQDDISRLEQDGVKMIGKDMPIVFTHPKTTDGIVLEITEMPD